MTYAINTQRDVFKLALLLYDYLSQHGHVDEAERFNQLVDSCYPQDKLALEAHLKAFRQIKTTIPDLPLAYVKAIDEAEEILADNQGL
ncbi:hypothetical protein Desaci_2806 [Desulfosporosinus acidiphilus SJ4]|uniref:Uncharacterized protein n=1 Tax=Desulfosporosinus acidiphilus (strain DSM 22704 / JCM 16185 / SJ4) TaxID=646529 RepID=I4D7F7_DESAJ|nr:adenylate cyclase [Desulfosporosinus acidiphilus]AFM41731.1 hypothetical protein Desaci_2806 [Desulfosporosinus acidiphilus SJ4]